LVGRRENPGRGRRAAQVATPRLRQARPAAPPPLRRRLQPARTSPRRRPARHVRHRRPRRLRRTLAPPRSHRAAMTTASRAKRTKLIAMLSAASLVTGSVSASPIRADPPKPTVVPPKAYYLALGDSVAYGYQQAKVDAGLPPSAFDTGYV